MARWLAATAMVLVGWLSLSAKAGAQGAKSPDELIREGIELRRQDRTEEALVRFKQALALQATPRALAQVALAEQALGHWPDAERHLTAALEATADSWIAKNRAPLAGALETIQKHLGSISVEGTPRGAEVKVNGIVVGVLPLKDPVRVTSGSTILEIRAPGYIAVTRVMAVGIGESIREQVALLSAPPSFTSSSPPWGLPEGVRTTPLDSERQASVASDGKYLRWISGTGAIAALATGVVLHLVARSKYLAFNAVRDAQTSDHLCYRAEPNAGGSQCASYLQAGDRAFLAAIITDVLAGALATTWTIATVMYRPRPGRPVARCILPGLGVRCVF
jgi:hypothetical protein